MAAKQSTTRNSVQAKRHEYAGLTDHELLRYCQELYAKGGISALSYTSLAAKGALYSALYARGLSQTAILAKLSLTEEYARFKANSPRRYAGREQERWSWERVVREAKAVVAEHGRLPPAMWFQKNKMGSLVEFVYRGGRTWDQLQDAVGDKTGTTFVESRNGMRWRSHAEASFSNFLYARGIAHTRGERYPDAYAKRAGAKYALFDVHFLAKDGAWVDVEIWGDNPGGHGEEHYAKKRKAKERFNKGNARFLGIPHQQCYDEDSVTEVLKPFIGVIEPFIFDKPTDRVIVSTHWSNADELLDYCKTLAAQMPDGAFPTEEWLRKRGKWASRPGPAYNTLSIYIKTWLGGVRNLRVLLGQGEISTTQWTPEITLDRYREFVNKHQMTPGQVRSWTRRKKPGVAFAKEVVDEAGRLESAVVKYLGGTREVQRLLGVTPKIEKVASRSAR